MRFLRRAVVLVTVATACSSSGEPSAEEPVATGTCVLRVVVTGETELSNISVTSAVGSATTDATGAVAITGLTPGRTILAASAPSTLEGTRLATCDVRAGVSADAGVVTFTPLGKVHGTVSVDGAPAAAALVAVDAATSTTSSGTYALERVRTGPRTVVASRDGKSGTAVVNVAWKKDVEAPPIALGWPGGTSLVHGHVRLEGDASYEGVTVVAAGPTPAVAVSDPTGHWSFAGLAPGAYDFALGASSTMEGTVAKHATLAAGDNVVEDVTFHASGGVRGRVTLAGRSAGNAGTLAMDLGASLGAGTDDAGEYLLARVPVGTHTLEISHGGYVGTSVVTPTVTRGIVVDAPSVDLVAIAGSYSVTAKAKLLGSASSEGALVRFADVTVTTAADGTYSLGPLVSPPMSALRIDSGVYTESIPNVLASPGSPLTTLNDSIVESIASIELARGRRVLTGTFYRDLTSADGSVHAAETGEGRVLAYEAATGTVTTVTASARGTVLAPDGKHLAFIYDDFSLSTYDKVGLFDLASHATTVVSSGGEPSFTPDSKHLLVRGWTYPAQRLEAVAAAGTGTVVLSDKLDVYDSVQVSADGSLVAFTTPSVTFKRTLWRSHLASGETKAVGEVDGPLGFLFGPTGILFYADTTAGLRMVPADGSAAVSLVPGVAKIVPVSSSKAAALSSHSPISFHLVDLATGVATPIASDVCCWSPKGIAVSPDGEKLAYYNAVTSPELHFRDASGDRVVATGPVSTTLPITISADGAWVSYVTTVGAETRLVRVATSGGGTVETIDTLGASPLVRISRDGKYFATISAGNLRFGTLDKSVAPIAITTSASFLEDAFSPDGSMLLYVQSASPPTLWVLPTSKPTNAIPIMRFPASARWTSGNRIDAVRGPYTVGSHFQDGVYVLAP